MVFSYLNHVFVLFLIEEYPTYQMDGAEDKWLNERRTM